MVNNAINISKTNNHLSHKTTEHKKNTTSDDGNPVMIWEGHNNVTGLNQFLWELELQRQHNIALILHIGFILLCFANFINIIINHCYKLFSFINISSAYYNAFYIMRFNLLILIHHINAVVVTKIFWLSNY